MYIRDLSTNFNSIDDFFYHFGDANKEKVLLDIPRKNEILIKSTQNDNSLNISILKKQKLLQAGKTYTISCDFILSDKIKKTLPYDVPKIALDGAIGNEIKYDVQSSSSIPNEIGTWHKSLTVTIPNDFTHAWFRIHAGIEKDAGELLIKNIVITETNFEFNPNSPIFYKEGSFYILRNFTQENIHELYKEFGKFIDARSFKPISEIIKYIENPELEEKLSIYSFIIKNDIPNFLKQFESQLPKFKINDEILVVYGLKFLARKLEWNKLSELIKKVEEINLYQNNIEIFYLKAQLYRRLKNSKLEQENYQKALHLDNSKSPINWELFFDSYNPGLVYRKEELQFLVSNLSEIQRIADYYKPKNINFKTAPVFIFWDQGYDKAPPIVKVMIDRMKKIYGSRLVILNGENLEAYVDLSAGIRKFRERERAFFADFVRTELLLKYGGTWIDSTAFTTKRFDHEVTSILTETESNFYALRIPKNPYRISNWFLSTNQINNRIIALMYSALLIYTEKYNHTFEYYQYHSFFEFLTQLDREAHDDFLRNYKDDYQPHAHDVLSHFRNDWDEKLFESLVNRCPIQKLTYRSNLLHLRTQSFYKTILRNGVNL